MELHHCREKWYYNKESNTIGGRASHFKLMLSEKLLILRPKTIKVMSNTIIGGVEILPHIEEQPQINDLIFDSFEKVRAEEAFKKNPKFREKLRELFQNEPWTDVMSELEIKVNLLKGGNGFTLSLRDDDIGSCKKTFLSHLLKINQRTFTDKEGDNKYGQGLQLMVLETNHNPTQEIYSHIYVEMKPKGGVAMGATLYGDVNRSILWQQPAYPKVRGESGWFVKMTFAGMSQRHHSHSPEGFVEELYSILKEEYFAQLKDESKKISIKLSGRGKWKESFVNHFKDLDDVQPKTEYYYTDTSHTKLANTMNSHGVKGSKIQLETKSGIPLTIDKAEWGKRPGFTELMDRNLVTSEKEYLDNVYSAEMGDKPKITICSIRTGNVLHQAFVKNQPVHMNGMEWRVYVDIQDASFESTSLTKTPFFEKDDERLSAIVDWCKEEWVELYPDANDAEAAYEWWITDSLKASKKSWVKKLYRGEVLYTVKDDKGDVVHEIRGLDGFEHYLEGNKQWRNENILSQFAKGPGRPDITMTTFDTSLMPTEVKPKAFNESYINQVLGYYISAPKTVRQTILWGYNMKPKHYKKLNDHVAAWKSGKLEQGDRFIYIDIQQLGFNDAEKSKYMKKVKQRNHLQKEMNKLKG